MNQELSYKISHKVNPTQWNEDLKKSDYANFFQTYEFLQLQSSLGIRFPIFIQIYNKSEVVGQLGLVIRKSAKAYSSNFMQKYVDLFSDLGTRGVWVGGPVIHSTEPKNRLPILEKILQALDQVSKENDLSIIDGYTSHQDSYVDSDYINKFVSNDFHFENFFTYATKLDQDLDSLWKKVQNSTRRDVNRAKKRNLEIKELDNFSQLDEYDHLTEQWGKTKGIEKHTEDEKHKNELWNCIQSGTVKIFLAYDNLELIASYAVGIFNGIVVYHIGRNSYSKAANLGGPILTWHAIEWAKTHGMRIYDFSGGKSPPKKENSKEFKDYQEHWETLLNYKKKWGGEEFHYHHLIKVRKKTAYKLFRTISKPDWVIRNYRKKHFKKSKKR